jgi:hypothetical protein
MSKKVAVFYKNEKIEKKCLTKRDISGKIDKRSHEGRKKRK